MKAGIVGTGLIGRLLAFYLVQRGWHVTLFDKDSPVGKKSCAYAAAGMLCPYAEIEHAEEIIYQLGKRSLMRWPSLINNLNQPIYFQQNGSILIAHSQDQLVLNHYINKLTHKLKHPNEIQILTTQSLHVLEPDLPARSKAFHLISEGHIHCVQLLMALYHVLITNRVIWQANYPVINIQPYCISTHEKNYRFDTVFDCRGLGGKSIFPQLRGVRGEAVWVHAPEVTLTRPLRLIHPRYQMYIVPRSNHHYVIGASEIESDDMSPISVKTTLELLSAAYSVHPGFAEAKIINTIVNCRPALPDNKPAIKYVDGLMAVNGLYRHGFLIAPALVDEMILLLEKGINAMTFPELVCGSM